MKTIEQVSIYWRNNVTGVTGNGTRKMTVKEANEIINQANKKYKSRDKQEIFHWYE